MSQIQFSFSLLRSRFILITLGPTITAITSRETRAGAFLNGTVQQKKREITIKVSGLIFAILNSGDDCVNNFL